ncbi:MAG TPA: YihY/virulence factor BrkB family protein [Xanthobacteraceae bacterium]|nr:YihY/virulence factor BrkB family protein [Xanthobacteraceae bacterium]HZP75312.1 YihY/virulence factor BrkB family protein [Pseudolabrys sp.]
MHLLLLPVRIAVAAFRQFLADEGWAIASHIALSTLMSMFPFIIVVTALAAFFFGSKELADEAARILLEAWPKQVAAPIADDIHGVLTNANGSVLTFGVVFALYFASSGVESLRIALNRAYNAVDPRSMWLTRLESIGYVIVGAVALLAFSFLVVLAPLIWAALIYYVPKLEPFGYFVTFARFTVAAIVIVIALTILHRWLPAGRRRFADVAPGIAVTLLLWLVSGAIFGRYLADFAFGYVRLYAGLASAMVALIFLYICASIFIYGAELNSTIVAARSKRVQDAEAPVASSTSS